MVASFLVCAGTRPGRAAGGSRGPETKIGYNVIEMILRAAHGHAGHAATTAAEAEAGSPSWWAARRIPRPGPRRGRPRRSFGPIVAAAAALLDELGVERFNMRALALRLGTSTATLYRHVAGKDELLAWVVDELFAELPTDEGEREVGGIPPPDWRVAAETGAGRFHELLGRHPATIPLLAAQVPVGPNALAARERAISALVAGGLPVQLAARAFTTIGHYVIGFSAQEHAAGAPGPEHAAGLRDFYLELDPEEYRTTIAAAEALTSVSAKDEFAEGLRFILDGIEAARRAG
jgi:AcrR family transcriptional regulator